MSTQLHLKANCRGSWTNVCSFPLPSLPSVKAGAVEIAKAAGGTVSFKVVNDHNVTLHSLDARQQPLVWADRLN